MDKVIEELMKERLPIHPRCKGEGFTADEAKNLIAGECSRIEALDRFESDKTDGSKDPEQDSDIEIRRCTTYVNPSMWWREGKRCPMADHYQIQKKDKTEKVRAGQQKQKKKK